MTMREISYVRAIYEALREEMRRDKRVFLMGEDVELSVYGATKGLLEEFGRDRVRNTPITEAAVVGASLGASLVGVRPVVDLMQGNFLYVAMDQFANQAAKARYMFGEQITFPVVYMAATGAFESAGAQHSDSPHPMFMNVGGLKVVMPSTPYDARGLLRSAFKDLNPVLILEHKLLYGSASPGGKAVTAVDKFARWMTPAPEEDYELPFGVADVKRSGSDLTIVATSFMVHRCLKITAELEQREGIHIEVVDPRTIVPLDIEAICRSVSRTGRCLIVAEETGFAGVSAEIAAQVSERAFDYLDAPVMRVNAMPTPIPFNYGCEAHVLPSEERILQAIRALLR